jgi:flagellar biosynthesis regulator FlaF
MANLQQASRAYAASAANRPLREQEADVFRRASAALRHARQSDEKARLRALADNERLWTAVVDLVRDPENALPPQLRGSLVSIGLAVQREMRAPAPDLEFLIGINDQIAAGLSGDTGGRGAG